MFGKEQKKEYPRYWPILFVLNKLHSLESHFRLQKYIFLAKVEKRIPIDYIFIKETHGPYCVDIKHDARELKDEGLILMEWNPDNPRWSFTMREEHISDIEKIISGIPEKWRKKFSNILEKYKNFSTTELEKHIYRHHVRGNEKNAQILSSIKSTAQTLEKSTNNYPPNYNSFLIQGIVEYCLLALKRNPTDIIQQDYLLRNIHYLLSSVTEIVELVSKSPECLAKVDLRDLEEEFEQTQRACKEVVDLPMLEEMDLAHLTS